MIYRTLRKLEQQKRDIQSLIIAAYQSGADPDVVMVRVSDLEWDMDILDREIEEERARQKNSYELPYTEIINSVTIGLSSERESVLMVIA